MMMVLLCSHG